MKRTIGFQKHPVGSSSEHHYAFGLVINFGDLVNAISLCRSSLLGQKNVENITFGSKKSVKIIKSVDT